MDKTGVLLVNLGTPDSATPSAVFRYLMEFLTDGRVIDLPWLWRQILVRGLIVPRRYRASANLYQRIWTSEGSPLLLHSKTIQRKLQETLGEDYQVALAMRYQKPSIAKVLSELELMGLKKLIVFPLFPQYASATTGSVHQRVMNLVSRWQVIPHLEFIHSYATHPLLIEAFYQRGLSCDPKTFDHLVFSFHGLPEKHLRKANPSGCCLQSSSCCETLHARNHGCYRAQCVATAQALATKFALTADQYSLCFQSRLGKEPWTGPYTDETIRQLALKGHKRLLVFAPAFTCDCLETLDEIGHEYAHQFQQYGGETLKLVPSLNDHPVWIDALRSIITGLNQDKKNRCEKGPYHRV